MGLVIDPNAPAPVPAASATSPDGYVTVTADTTWGGAEIVVDFSAVAEVPHHVRVHRRDPDGSVHTVRGADPNLSPGGISPAYDHEAPLGVTATWWAVGYDRAGSVLVTSGEAALSVGWGGSDDAWLKSIADPGLSRRVYLSTWEESGRDSRAEAYAVHGRSSRTVALGVPARVAVGASLVTNTEADYRALDTLLDSGVLMVDAPASYGITRCYVVRLGDAQVSRNGDLPGWRQRVWQVGFEVIDAPPTDGSLMRTPAVSWETLPYATYTEMGDANPTWLDLMNG